MVDERRGEEHEREQEQAVVGVGHFGAGAVIDVRRTADDFRDHREPTDAGSERIGEPDGDQVAVEVRLALPRVEQFDGFGGQERFQTPDEREEHEVFEAGSRRQPAEVGEGERVGRVGQHVRDRDEKLGPDGVLAVGEIAVEMMGREKVRMLVIEFEGGAQADGHDENYELRGDLAHPFVFDHLQPEEDSEADEADEGDLRIQFFEFAGEFPEQLEGAGWLAARRGLRGGHADDFVQLFGNDDDADTGEHAVDRGQWEEVGESSGLDQAEQDLHHPRGDADPEGELVPHHGPVGVGQVGPEVRPQFGDRPGDDHDESGRRTFDRQLGVTEERRDEAADHGGPYAGDRRKPTRAGNGQAERHRDQEDQEPGDGVEAEVPERTGEERRCGRIGGGLGSHISGPRW